MVFDGLTELFLGRPRPNALDCLVWSLAVCARDPERRLKRVAPGGIWAAASFQGLFSS